MSGTMCDAPLVAIVILHWGSPEMTMECIKSVCESEYSRLIIVVVDNCPEQRLPEKSLETNGAIVYIPLETNVGYCGGNNVGIRRAQDLRAKYILLLNNDTVIDKSMIHHCVNYMEDQSELAVLSPKLFFHHKPQHLYLVRAELNIASEIIFVGWDERDVGQYEEEKEITFAHGSALFARASIFERVGLFDERLFCYGEDGDLSRRIGEAGMRMMYYPKAKVWHKCSSLEFDSKGILSNTLATYYMWRNRLFSVRHYINKGRTRGYYEFASGFAWRFASNALKYRRFDLCIAMILGLFDAVLSRMGKRDYALFRCRSYVRKQSQKGLRADGGRRS